MSDIQKLKLEDLKEESILIQVSGGLIQDISFPKDDQINSIVRVLDYDTDGTESVELVYISDQGEAVEAIWENPNYKKTPEDSEIKSIETNQTGGNVFNDIITLKDDRVLVINTDVIVLYDNREDYENCIHQDNTKGWILR